MIDLDKIFLTPGYHEPHQGQYCVMEAAAAYSGLEWTDTPETVNGDIARLLQAINDWTESDNDRQNLKELVPLVTQTGGTYSAMVKQAVDVHFTWDEEKEGFAFRMPDDPMSFAQWCIDQVTFAADMAELFPV